MKAILVLEDKAAFFGNAIIRGESIGEVIFNTAVVGYQEILTNPVYAGKILVLTYPLIGNYGVAEKFNQTSAVWPAGLVIKEKSKIYSNWQAQDSLDGFINKHKLLTITDIDTRTLTVHLRENSYKLGIISTENFDIEALVKKIKNFSNQKKESFLPKISTDKIKYIGSKNKKLVAVLDLGLTEDIRRQLESLFSLVILPYDTTLDKILSLNIKGLIISSGPEEDIGLEKIVENIKPLIGKVPILGISVGCQILARCLGAKLIKLKVGHFGLNYPIKSLSSYKGQITIQNHSYVIDEDSLKNIKSIEITAYNLNDNTVEEFESKKLKILGVQYDPVSLGFGEINPVFFKFLKML